MEGDGRRWYLRLHEAWLELEQSLGEDVIKFANEGEGRLREGRAEEKRREEERRREET